MTKAPRILVVVLALALAAISSEAAPKYGFFGRSKAQLEALMDVVYFVVPRSELAKAVVSRDAAAAIEAVSSMDPRKSPELYPFSVIVFAKSSYTASHAYGRIRLKMSGRKRGFYELDIPSLSIGTDSVFVIDGGTRAIGTITGAKSVEWLEIKSLK